MLTRTRLCLALLLLPGLSPAALIAHYTFDADGTAAVGADATLGDAATIDNTSSAVGAGSLLLGGPVTDGAGNNGAVSGNSFAWATDTRSVAFWMQAGTQTDANPTMVSLGSGAGAGNRFDVRLNGSNLRLEVQSGGSNTTVPVGDGSWYHVTIVVPSDGSTVATTEYYVHDTSAALVASGAFGGSGTGIATGDGPLRVGDSYQDGTRDFIGHIDDLRLYDEALDATAAQSLAALWNPVPEPHTALLGALGCLALLRRRRS